MTYNDACMKHTNSCYSQSKRAIKKRILKVVVLIAVVAGVLSFPSLSVPVKASVISRDDAALDLSLSDQENATYAPTSRILLTQIPIPAGIHLPDSDSMYHGLYYYLITHLGFVDMPFNYIVTWEGLVYEGKAGGRDVQPLLSDSVDDSFKNSVLIAYYGNNQEMTYAGKDALVDTVSLVQTYAGLSDDAVVPVGMSMVSGSGEVEVSELVVVQSTDTAWNAVVDEVKIASSANSDAADTAYSGEIDEIEYNEEVQASENFVVTATVTNTGALPWYNDGDHPVYLATSDPRDRESALFVSDRWSSFARVVVAEENWVLPGEIGTFSFEIATPLRPGTYAEKFELLRMPDQWIEGTQFEVSFTVIAGDFDLVEILETETGYLNVRDCPSAGCNELGKVVPGDVLIKTGSEGSWYKIQMDDGREGWVSGRYVREL